VILTSSDGGASFQQRASGSTVHLAAVWGAGREVFAAGFGPGLLHSTDFGATWTEIATTMSHVWGLWGSSPTNLYALSSRIYHSDDHGATWTELAGERTGEGLWGAGSYVYVVGPSGRISRTSDRGKTWTRLATGTTKDLRRITGHGADLVAIGGDTAEGLVLRSRDAGQTWHEERVPTRAPTFDAVITDAATFVLGNVDVILRGPR
jgi:photosystem II stability/assembly factor-like uncharacterized protein